MKWVEYFVPVLFVGGLVTLAYFFGDKLSKKHKKKAEQEFIELKDYIVNGGETPKIVKNIKNKEIEIARIRRIIEDSKVNHFYN